MRFKLLLITLVLIYTSTSAQQDALFSNYIFNEYVLNPAYAGSKGSLDAVMAIRNQWAGFSGSPKTQSLSLHTPLTNKKLGTGFSIVNDKLGATNITGFRIAGSYRVKILKRRREIGRFAIGLRMGLLKYGINWSELKTTDPDDQIVLLGQSTNKITVPDLGLGFLFETHGFYAGLSLPHLIQSKVDFTGSKAQGINEDPSHIRYHIVLTAGYMHELRDEVKIKPSILLKSVVGAPIQLDISTTAMYKERVRFGFSYRTGSAFVLLTEFWFRRQFRIGYAIDVATSSIQTQSNGSHEIMMGYQFYLKKTKKQILNSRYNF